MDEQQDNRSDTEDESEKLLGLEGFRQADDDGGLSLEALSAAYAELIDRGAVPYEVPAAAESAQEVLSEEAAERSDEDCEVTPRSIFEAMLFVGDPDNQALTSEQVASLMRGVRPHEIDDLVGELNAEYERLGCPYWIVSQGGGYRLTLREAYAGLREKFYRRVREARLSQAAVDVLAIVAYRQPLNREQVDKLRGRPSGGILAQLVRRQLLRLERPADAPRRPTYCTTDRFLKLFGLASLSELPQTQEIDRDF